MIRPLVVVECVGGIKGESLLPVKVRFLLEDLY